MNTPKLAKAKLLVDPGDFSLCIHKRAGFGGLGLEALVLQRGLSPLPSPAPPAARGVCRAPVAKRLFGRRRRSAHLACQVPSAAEGGGLSQPVWERAASSPEGTISSPDSFRLPQQTLGVEGVA